MVMAAFFMAPAYAGNQHGNKGAKEISSEPPTPEMLREVDEINQNIRKKGAKWKAGVTSMIRLSPEERKARAGGLLLPPEEQKLLDQMLKELVLSQGGDPSQLVSSALLSEATTSSSSSAMGTPSSLSTPSMSLSELAATLTLPAKLDYRDYNGGNYVTSVKNQECGNCWAFASTAALESRVLLDLNMPGVDLDLSEKITTVCSGAGSCSGGWMVTDFFVNTGLPPESDYTGSIDGGCSAAKPGWQLDSYKATGYQSWRFNSVEEVKTALFTYGPMFVEMVVWNEFFAHDSGIYSWSGEPQGYTLHAVELVGYDDENSCFIAKNSWGTRWGEEGFFRIAYSQFPRFAQFGLAYTGAYGPRLGSIINTPVSGSTLKGTNYIITGFAAPNPSSRVQEFSVSTDGGASWYPAIDTSGDGSWRTWNYNWTLPADGFYDRILLSRAVDVDGTIETPRPGYSITVDNTPPELREALYVVGNYIGRLDGAFIDGRGATISIRMADNLSVPIVELSEDGGAWITVPYVEGYAGDLYILYSWRPSSAGPHQIKIRGTDGAGNITEYIANISSGWPTSTITAPINGAAVHGASIPVTGTAADTSGAGLRQVEVSMDGGATWALAAGTANWSYTWASTVIPGASYNIRSRATDNAGRVELPGAGVTVTGIPITITADCQPSGRTGVAYSCRLIASNGVEPYRWSTSGILPPGLALTELNPTTAEITGYPDASGTYTFTVQVTDEVSITATKALSIAIYDLLTITTATLPNGAQGREYNQVLSASGGSAPYTWSVTGNFPAGLKLNDASGEITKAPAASGWFDFTVRVTDANSVTADKSFNIWIDPDTTAPTTTAYPAGGTYIAAQNVILKTNGAATIYCTTDGSMPVVPDSVCPTVVRAVDSLTLKYFSVDPYGNREDVKTETYTITGGEVWGWGENDNRQLNDGTWENRNSPVQIIGMSDVIDIAGAYVHSIALKRDGTIRTWGNDNWGQLGWGNDALTGITAVAAGTWHSVVLKKDGTVWAWGANYYGQLGYVSQQANPFPSQVPGLSDCTAVASAAYYSAALKKDGTVWAWGGGNPTVRQVDGLNGIVALAMGESNQFALKNDGTVWDWSNGGTIVDGLSSIVAIAAGANHTLALKNDGTVWAWGDNSNGQFGDGTRDSSSIPIQVPGLADVKALAAGTYHSVALKNDGTVWAWGVNVFGELGDNTNIDSTVPVQVANLSAVVALGHGWRYTFAVKQAPLTVATESLPATTPGSEYRQHLAATGGLRDYSWSVSAGTLPAGLELEPFTGLISGSATIVGEFNFTIQVTDANNVTSTKDLSIGVYDPVSITTTSLAPGTYPQPYSQTLSAAGGKAPYSWSISGSLPFNLALNRSTGEITGRPYPAGTYTFTVQVTDAASIRAMKEFSITIYDQLTITTATLPNGEQGREYGQVLSASGGLAPYTWSVAGNFPAGLDLNPASGEISKAPVVAAAWFGFTVSVTDANSMTADKYFYIFIDPDTTAPTTTVYPAGGSYITAQNVVLKTNEAATIYCTTDGSMPVVPDSVCPTVVRAVDSLTLKYFSVDAYGNREDVKNAVYSITGGDVWAWGQNIYGQLGDGTGTFSSIPVKTTGLQGVVSAAAGASHSIAVLNDGTVWTWGGTFMASLETGRRTTAPFRFRCPG